jgi:ubiquinone/menaquinone biosynthesis C-methylase UbiE
LIYRAIKRKGEEARIDKDNIHSGDAGDTKMKDNEFDSTFCDKLLLHISPCEAVLGEMVHVTKNRWNSRSRRKLSQFPCKHGNERLI